MGKRRNPNNDIPPDTKPSTVGCSMIPIINKLQDIIAPFGSEFSKIALPQIAVVGSQSSGKSSVLEALVGRDFLPRGSEICTRRPLVLMLENRPQKGDADDEQEWGEFRHLPGKKFYDFTKIRQEIQILEQHIRTDLPGLKALLNSRMVAVVKELRTYGEVMASKAERGAVLLTILTKYSEALSNMVDGKSQEMSTKELSGGARIHFILQSIFVKRLEEVDPCEDLTDEDIRTSIQNATGPKKSVFVPEVPFEVLVRRQIARLLDPSLQCLRLVCDELIKMSRACELMEMQRFPLLRRRMDEAVGKFLHDGVKPAEIMIGNIIEMEMGFINSSHPNFIGGSKAVELAMQQLRSSQDGVDGERVRKSERSQTSQAVPTKSTVNQGNHPQLNNDKPASAAGHSSTRTWIISSIFSSKTSSGEDSASQSPGEIVHDMEQSESEQIPSTINLGVLPSILRPSGMTEQEAVEIIVTKLLLKSYYDIVRKNMQDLVPKAIMHFLVNHTKRDLLSVLIQKLYSENLFEEMFHEQDDVAIKRKRTQEMFQVLQQAVQTLDEVESDVSSQSLSSSSGSNTSTEFPEISAFPSNLYQSINGEKGSSYTT